MPEKDDKGLDLSDKKLEYEMRKVDDLIPYARNARTHSKDQINQIAGSIKEFGFISPVIIDNKGGVIAGHGRLMAAQKLGLKEVPCVIESHLTENQKRAYILADNRLALNAGWDREMMNIELSELKADDFDLEMLGFSENEVNYFLTDLSEFMSSKDVKDAEEEEESEIDVVTEGATVTKPGDVWILGAHRLICGDSTDADTVKKLMGDRRPNFMVTDPPYGVKYDPEKGSSLIREHSEGRAGKVLNDDRADWTEAYALFPGNIAYVWHGNLATDLVLKNLKDCGFTLNQMIIWNKSHFAIGLSDYNWKHEPCIYATKGPHNWQGGRNQSTVWDIPIIRSLEKSEGCWGHGTQKPIECMKRPIENNTTEGEYVYDPFCGSGTTIIAAERSMRKALGIELSPHYCDAIVRRWESETRRKAILEETGERFDDLEAQLEIDNEEE